MAFSDAAAIFILRRKYNMENRNETLKKLVLSAVMIAIGTVLSHDPF